MPKNWRFKTSRFDPDPKKKSRPPTSYAQESMKRFIRNPNYFAEEKIIGLWIGRGNPERTEIYRIKRGLTQAWDVLNLFPPPAVELPAWPFKYEDAVTGNGCFERGPPGPQSFGHYGGGARPGRRNYSPMYRLSPRGAGDNASGSLAGKRRRK
jgi:hypothetical protein